MREILQKEVSMSLISASVSLTPHRQVLNKHFKKVVIMNRFLELAHIRWLKSSLAEHSPVYRVEKRNIVRRRLAAISHNTFSEALLVAESTLSFRVHILGETALLTFLIVVFVRMRATKRK
jgi:hypothetical protein